MPGYVVVNFVDDSILPQLARNGGNIADVEHRFLQYFRFAEEVGATGILSACSSVGELVSRAAEQVSVPVVRIDDAMAEEAVKRGSSIGVAATLPTTLNPTMRLLRGKAELLGKSVELSPVLAEAAYQRLSEGDKEGHDALLANILERLARSVDVVVLAQASMARVIPRLPEALQEKFLSSPRSGVERVRKILEGAAVGEPGRR